MYKTVFIIGCFLISSNQHFIWPLSFCLLADICNHTWIPLCAKEDGTGFLKLFNDECDMFEYNCDNLREYYRVPYADCFSKCGLPSPCDFKCQKRNCSTPAESDSKKATRAANARKMILITPLLPPHMLSGKRRHTPTPRIWRYTKNNLTSVILSTSARGISGVTETMTKTISVIKTSQKMNISSKTETIRPKSFKKGFPTQIIKKETVMKNGVMMMKVVMRYISPPSVTPVTAAIKPEDDSSGYLE